MRKLAWLLGLSLFCLWGVAAPAGDKKDFFFKNGDRVVVMGDSITEQHLYSNYLEMWTVTRFPTWKLTLRNVGIGGDTSGGGNGRFKRDVLAHDATALTVDFGMNDGRYNLGAFDEKAFAVYMKGLQGIADQARAAKVRVAWITPQPVEHNPGAKGELYNNTLEKFSEGVKTTADKNGGLFVDQFHPYWAVIKKARDNGEKGRITAGDAVHPGPPGQVVMAASILKGLGFPTLVSSAVIADGKAVDATNCVITAVKASAEGVEFTRLDAALPFFPEEAKGILKFSPVLTDMNQLDLKVTGLKSGKYDVALDGKVIGTYPSGDLAKGVNLAEGALKAGPIADQVKGVRKAVEDKNRYFHDKIFRGVLLAGSKSPDFKGATGKDLEARRKELYDERMKEMPAKDEAVRAALTPRAYVVSIRLAKSEK